MDMTNNFLEVDFMLIIKETKEKDLGNIKELWSSGEVMKFVGFPNGLIKTNLEMKEWYNWIDGNRPLINHYSIFEDDTYLGETFYNINPKTQNASLDIKLFPKGRGKGYATKSLKFTIAQAILNGAKCAWVDPNKDNIKALNLYRRVGMIEKELPDFLKENDSLYFETGNLTKWHFEITEEAANYLLKLVIEGKKRATSSSLKAYEIEGDCIPQVGELSLVTYFDGTPGALIQTTNVRLIPYSDITFDIAKLEGEDETIESWRSNHDHFFTEEGKMLGYEWDMNSIVIFEEFEVVYIY